MMPRIVPVTTARSVNSRIVESDAAAGVGHEINNPLAYVLANLEFVTSELEMLIGELPREAHERLEARIADLTQALADTNHGAQRVREHRGDGHVGDAVDLAQPLRDHAHRGR